jgi:PAS domain S-box-containing protein
MRIRTKSLLINCLVFIFLLITFVLSVAISLNKFDALERVVMRNNVQRIASLIDERIASIDSKLSDWSSWDDSYQFINDSNPAFIEKNVDESVLKHLNLHFISFYDLSGEPVYGFGTGPAAPSGGSALSSSLAKTVGNLAAGSRGILYVEGKAVLVAVRPIVRTGDKGAVRGKLAFGRYFDGALMQELSGIAGYPFQLHRILVKRANHISQANEITVESGNSGDRIAGYKTVKSITGEPAAIIEVIAQRQIYRQGWQNIIMIGFMQFGFGAIIIGILFLLTEKLIFSRVVRLNTAIGGMAAGHNPRRKIELPGNDEISDLSVEINRLIGSLAVSEQELKESESKYRTIFENTGTALIIVNGGTGNIALVNSEFERLSDYSKAEAAAMNIEKIIRAEDRAKAEEYNSYFTHKPLFIRNSYDFMLVRKNGKFVPVMATVASLSGSYFVWSLLDITERKRIEDNLKNSEQRMTDIFNFLPDATFAIDLEGRVIVWNRAIEEMTGLKASEIIGKGEQAYSVPFYGTPMPLLLDMVLRPELMKGNDRYSFLKQDRDVLIAESSTSRPDGKLACYWSRAAKLFDTSGRMIGAIESIRDITARKKTEALLSLQTRELESRAAEMEDSRLALLNMMEDIKEEVAERSQKEKELEVSLKEKDVLLKEVHHRVKNNLQVISSLLNLQSKYIRNPDDLQMFAECQNRIRTMVFIHEKLYRSKDFANIDFGDYITVLVKSLFNSYSVSSNRVALELTVDKGISFGVDRAVPCGLIINELVSNSLKYAFPDGGQGVIRIELRQNGDGSYTLMIGDDGRGFPEAVDFRNTQSLGLQLVTTLVEQLNGTIRREELKGVSFVIDFGVTDTKGREDDLRQEAHHGSG